MEDPEFRSCTKCTVLYWHERGRRLIERILQFSASSAKLELSKFPLKTEKQSAVSFPSCHTTKLIQKWPTPPPEILNEKHTSFKHSFNRPDSQRKAVAQCSAVLQSRMGFNTPGAGSSELNTTFCGLWVCVYGGLLWPILLPTWDYNGWGEGGGRWSGLPPPHLYTVKMWIIIIFVVKYVLRVQMQFKHRCLKSCIGLILITVYWQVKWVWIFKSAQRPSAGAPWWNLWLGQEVSTQNMFIYAISPMLLVSKQPILIGPEFCIRLKNKLCHSEFTHTSVDTWNAWNIL